MVENGTKKLHQLDPVGIAANKFTCKQDVNYENHLRSIYGSEECEDAHGT
jgi:hypothetical protein